MKNPRATYSVDWMQLFCSNSTLEPPMWEEKQSSSPDKWGNHRTYKLVTSMHYIKGYEWQREVVYKNYTVATVACCPKSDQVRKDGCAIKIANPVLYVADWYFILNDIIGVLGWQPLNITRVDLACDFNFFMNGVSPDTFIRKYVTKQKASYLRVGSNKFCIYGRKEMRCTIYDSIRWGSRQSGVSVYMYNKTKELDEVKDKPWIREAWQKANLSSTKAVWRVEISITSQGLGLKSMYNNLIHNLFIDELMTPELCRQMFQIYAAKYFRFVKTDPNAKRKRDLKQVELLNLNAEQEMKPVGLSEYRDTGRMEKIVSNKLDEMYKYIADRDFSNKYEMLQAIDKVKTMYNVHHSIKDRTNYELKVMEKRVADVITSTFDLPSHEETLIALHKGRKNIEEWQYLARRIAGKIVAKQLHAHFPSPSPRAVARNGLNVTT